MNPANAGVNCDGVPHTRLEIAICGEPGLRALDSELSAALNEALERGVIDRQSFLEQRNRIARHCRREDSTAFNACLRDAELNALEWAADALGQSIVSRSAVSNSSDRYDATLATRTTQLQRQLQLAEGRLRYTSDPELTVMTLLNLLNVTTEQQDRNPALIGKLEQRLASGCEHSVYGHDWRRLLRDNNLSCGDTQSPALFSSADI